MYEVVFLSGPRAGAIVALSGGERAGRSPECEVEVPDPNVSRQHAVFEFDGVTLRLNDLGSSNGSFVNEHKVNDGELTHGDTVRLGETRMRVQRRSQRSASSQGTGRTSVFGFREAEEDISQSMSMSMVQSPAAGAEQSPEVLSQRLNAIIWVGEQLSNISTLDELYGPVLDTLFEVFPQAERSFLMLGDQYESLVPKAMRLRNKNEKAKQDGQVAISSTLCNEALKRKEVIMYSDGGKTDFDQGMSIVSLNIRSAMVIPLIVKDEVLGLLAIDTSDRTRAFTKPDMELAAAVCRQIAISIKNASMTETIAEEERTRNNLMRFLPKPVVDQALDGALDLRLGGSTCHGTIFYADVIGFTRMSEKMSPEAVIGMMNEFFNRLVPCIEAENGAIDKFMGDCVMAFWGVPFSQEDAVQRACAAGLHMHNGLMGLNSLRAADGRPELGMGVGLDSGPVVAGNIGSEDRVEYTVLGNTANTAQRIQSQACTHQVLIGERAFKDAGGDLFSVRMPPVQVKNKSEPVATYSVRGVLVDAEILLHVPVRIRGEQCVIARRLSEGGFIVLHPNELDLNGQVAKLDIIELPDSELGKVEVVEAMTQQDVDGLLKRSHVTIGDGTLNGLLGDEPMATELTWTDMLRSASA